MWSIAEIETQFLDGKCSALALPPDAIAASFERVERELGRGWINSVVGKGTAPTLRIVAMGLQLRSIEGIGGSEKLIEKIQRGDLDAEAELTAIHLIRSSHESSRFELHPEVGNRKADFRVSTAAEPWITVEVTRPNTSKEHDRAQQLLRQIAAALTQSVDNQFTLDVVLRREPSPTESQALCDHLPDFCKFKGEHQAELVGGLGTLLLNKTPLGQVLKWTFVDRGNAPIIGLAQCVSRGDKPHHQVAVNMPFSDDRAEGILRHEARQLPPSGIGVVMIDVGRTIGSFHDWEAIFRRRFQPEQHTRVSAVCLFEPCSVPTDQGYTWLLHRKVITNPHAQKILPAWLDSAFSKAGREYDLVASKW